MEQSEAPRAQPSEKERLSLNISQIAKNKTGLFPLLKNGSRGSMTERASFSSSSSEIVGQTGAQTSRTGSVEGLSQADRKNLKPNPPNSNVRRSEDRNVGSGERKDKPGERKDSTHGVRPVGTPTAHSSSRDEADVPPTRRESSPFVSSSRKDVQSAGSSRTQAPHSSASSDSGVMPAENAISSGLQKSTAKDNKRFEKM